MKKLLTTLLMFWGVGAVGYWYWTDSQHAPTTYRTAKVEQGDLMATVNATGTLEPEEVVDVGAQVAGQIVSFGKDPSDPSKPIGFGTAVEQGTVLAQFDDALFKARVNQARASVARAEADVEQAQIKVRQAERDFQRVQKLHAKNSISSQEYDATLSDVETAKANLAVAKSAVGVAMANLEEASVNLGYTTIHAPVKGIIVDRRVNIGQTVISNLNAPSLFLIAKDLGRMEIWALVNETDVGQIHVDQPVRFTVSAYPHETFDGTVSQIRMNASMSQSVVTYTVVVSVENTGGRLLPYLTARVQFKVDERKNVLLVPNAALRWRPRPSQIVPEDRASFGNSTPTARPTEKTQATLWAVSGPFVRPVPVELGLSDGLRTEVLGKDLKKGTEIVVGESEETKTAETGEAESPFLPQIKNGKAKK